MADRMFYPEEGSYTKRLVRAEGSVTFGASSAVSSQSFDGGTFTKNASGDWTLTLSDVFNEIKSVQVTYNVNSTTPTGLVPQVYSVSVSSKTVKFKLLTGTVATDPGNGAIAYVSVTCKNSGV